MPKINLIIHFFLEILHFKEYYNLIGRQHFGPLLENQNFARDGIGGEISTTMLVFILNCFQEKLMTKFSKNFKNPILGQFLTLFAQTWVKMNFPAKKLSVFKYSNHLPSFKKSEKTKDPFLRKMPNLWTDIQKDRQR